MYYEWTLCAILVAAIAAEEQGGKQGAFGGVVLFWGRFGESPLGVTLII